MRASVGVGVGPIRLSQGLGLGVTGLVILAVGTMASDCHVRSEWAQAPYTTSLSDGIYYADTSAEAGQKVHPGKYVTKAAAKPTSPSAWRDDGKCRWFIFKTESGGHNRGPLLREGTVKRGRPATITLNMGEQLHTETDCGTWVWQQK
jgi:hypothetical protein